MSNNTNKNEFEIPIRLLLERHAELAGKLFTQVVGRSGMSEEEKEKVKMADFFMGLIHGNLQKEWGVENTEEFKEMFILAKAVAVLQKVSVKVTE